MSQKSQQFNEFNKIGKISVIIKKVHMGRTIFINKCCLMFIPQTI